MPKQRNKAHHLQALASATAVVNEARRRQLVQVCQARTAGATWMEVAEATGMATRQAAQQHFRGWETDGEHVWRQEQARPLQAPARGSVHGRARRRLKAKGT